MQPARLVQVVFCHRNLSEIGTLTEMTNQALAIAPSNHEAVVKALESNKLKRFGDSDRSFLLQGFCFPIDCDCCLGIRSLSWNCSIDPSSRGLEAAIDHFCCSASAYLPNNCHCCFRNSIGIVGRSTKRTVTT